MLQETTAQKKIGKMRKRVRIVRGGTSSSKTFSIIPMLITYAVQNPRVEISIVAESIPHLRRGAIRDFLKILQMVGMYKEQNWNKSSLTYTFSNEAFIEFFSADQPDKLRGARRDVLFINECNNIEWESPTTNLPFVPADLFIWITTQLRNFGWTPNLKRMTIRRWWF
jgi:phage terminase large subunit